MLALVPGGPPCETWAPGRGIDDDNGNGGQDSKDGKVSVLIVVVALITITMLLVAFVIVYKRNKIHNETTPLSHLEARRH